MDVSEFNPELLTEEDDIAKELIRIQAAEEKLDSEIDQVLNDDKMNKIVTTSLGVLKDSIVYVNELNGVSYKLKDKLQEGQAAALAVGNRLKVLDEALFRVSKANKGIDLVFQTRIAINRVREAVATSNFEEGAQAISSWREAVSNSGDEMLTEADSTEMAEMIEKLKVNR